MNDYKTTLGIQKRERLKENITTITGGLETINALTGKTFTWTEEADMQTGTQYGLIAQEAESVIPDLVQNESGIRRLDVDGNLQNIDEVIKLIKGSIDPGEAKQGQRLRNIACGIAQIGILGQAQVILQRFPFICQKTNKKNK